MAYSSRRTNSRSMRYYGPSLVCSRNRDFGTLPWILRSDTLRRVADSISTAAAARSGPEGTAQASLVMRAEGWKKEADALIRTALRQGSPSGYLYATDGGILATGLAIGPQSKGNDFFYYYRPHLGATAWGGARAEWASTRSPARVLIDGVPIPARSRERAAIRSRRPPGTFGPVQAHAARQSRRTHYLQRPHCHDDPQSILPGVGRTLCHHLNGQRQLYGRASFSSSKPARLSIRSLRLRCYCAGVTARWRPTGRRSVYRLTETGQPSIFSSAVITNRLKSSRNRSSWRSQLTIQTLPSGFLMTRAATGCSAIVPRLAPIISRGPITKAPKQVISTTVFAARPPRPTLRSFLCSMRISPPSRNILRRTVGLFADPRAAIVQTPQFFYNADPVQHNLTAAHAWVDDQRIFLIFFNRLKMLGGCAFCVGTSFLVRRDCLALIGGFPDGAICEDINLTYQLMTRGYETHWLNERLSVGLSAEGLPEYITQRTRWCLGTIQVALLRGWTVTGKGLFPYATRAFSPWRAELVMQTLRGPYAYCAGAYWFFGLPAFYADYLTFLRYGLPALFALWVYGGWISHQRTLPLFMEVTHTLAAPGDQLYTSLGDCASVRAALQGYG